ncbi:MAG: SAM-dependent methyltransferase [Mollicutes bacterium UO1]
MEGEELLHYVNERVLNYFQEKYGSDIFSPLQLKNPATLKRIIDKLDKLSLTDINSDIKGDAFEYFLKVYLSKQQKDLGEYFAPRHIVKFLVKLTNPRFGEKVYDPFCGTGGILIEAYRHMYQKMPRESQKLQILKHKTIYGGEITQTARITKMNMILSGDGHNNIKRQDSLKNPVRGEYDVVITNMPFSLGNYPEYASLYALGSANGNSLCIEHCLTALNKDYADGRIALIVPEGILFDRKFTKLREYIYQNSYVENIISLPTGTFAPYSNVKTSVFYLTVRKTEQKVV